jgi:hypothetical protein
LEDVSQERPLPDFERADDLHRATRPEPELPPSSPPIRDKEPRSEIERIRRFYEARQAEDIVDNRAPATTHDDLGVAAVKEVSPNLYSGRAGRPPVEPQTPITQILETEMLSLLRWIETDGKTRTEAQLFEEAFAYLRYSRHGPRIDQRIRKGIAQLRGKIDAPFADPFT